MPQKTLNEAVINLVNSLGVPARHTRILKEKDIIIPDNKNGKDQVCYYLFLLFAEYTQLIKTPKHQAALLRFSDQIGLGSTKEYQPKGPTESKR